MASEGDPRVLFAMNVVLSALFSTVVVYGLSVVRVQEFTWTNVAAATAVLALLTWVVVVD